MGELNKFIATDVRYFFFLNHFQGPNLKTGKRKDIVKEKDGGGVEREKEKKGQFECRTEFLTIDETAVRAIWISTVLSSVDVQTHVEFDYLRVKLIDVEKHW